MYFCTYIYGHIFLHHFSILLTFHKCICYKHIDKYIISLSTTYINLYNVFCLLPKFSHIDIHSQIFFLLDSLLTLCIFIYLFPTCLIDCAKSNFLFIPFPCDVKPFSSFQIINVVVKEPLQCGHSS